MASRRVRLAKSAARIIGALFSAIMMVAAFPTLRGNLQAAWRDYLLPILPLLLFAVGAVTFIASVLPDTKWARIIRWFKMRFGRGGKITYELPFNDPGMHGNWDGVGTADIRIVDAASAGSERAVQIRRREEFPPVYDHVIIEPIDEARSVEFVGKFTESSALYVNTLARRKEGGEMRVWLRCKQTGGSPNHDSLKEWAFAGERRELGDGWVSVNLDIPDAWGHTFGTDRHEFLGIIGFRLRDEMTIARITIRV